MLGSFRCSCVLHVFKLPYLASLNNAVRSSPDPPAPIIFTELVAPVETRTGRRLLLSADYSIFECCGIYRVDACGNYSPKSDYSQPDRHIGKDMEVAGSRLAMLTVHTPKFSETGNSYGPPRSSPIDKVHADPTFLTDLYAASFPRNNPFDVASQPHTCATCV